MFITINWHKYFNDMENIVKRQHFRFDILEPICYGNGGYVKTSVVSEPAHGRFPLGLGQ
jgi:hypothetical protein